MGIRLIIVLALIFGSLALDMSSAKERSATSAYTTLYTKLGFTEGYKSMWGSYGVAAQSESFQFYIEVVGANGKAVKIENYLSKTPITSFKRFLPQLLSQQL